MHQEGGEITPKRGKALSFGGRLFARVVMPARQYLGFGPRERAETETILTDHLIHLFAAGPA